MCVCEGGLNSGEMLAFLFETHWHELSDFCLTQLSVQLPLSPPSLCPCPLSLDDSPLGSKAKAGAMLGLNSG